MVRYFAPLMALSLFGTICLPAQSAPPKPVVAVFSEDDAQFSETITLYADGKYQQAETEKKTSLYKKYSVYSVYEPLQNISSPEPFLLKSQLDPKRNGIWRVLDKEGGQPIVFKTLANLPEDAVIEVKGAMPFGITWEHQFPYQSHGTRTLPASEFQPALPTKNSLPVIGKADKNPGLEDQGYESAVVCLSLCYGTK